ncbi:MAG: thiol reductant ABC exporter subunit CydC [Caldilinea sp.]|nr:thiol reductant ABC exporter subunit CydC [Caldilinea sp.]
MSTATSMAAAPRGVLRRLLELMAPFRWWIVAGVLLSFATVGSSVGLMAVSAYLISKAAIALDVTQLSLAIAGVRLFALTRAAFRYGERYVTHLATFRILTSLRVWFYTAIEPLAPARLQQTHSGDLLTRAVADVETLENFYVRVVVPPLAALLTTAVACAILGVFDLRLALVLALYMALTGVALPWASQWLSRQAAHAQIAQRSALNAHLVDAVQGMADLLAFGQAQQQRAAILAQSDQLHRAQERLATVRGVANALAALFTGLAGVTVLLLAIPLVSDGVIEGVYLALLPLTAIAAFEATQPLSQAFQTLEASRAAARRLFGLIDTPPAVVDPAQPLPPPAGKTLAVRNLHFSYPPVDDRSEKPVFNGVSFELRAGERLAITGPSGAGKSTLVALLLRFWDVADGAILLDGCDLRAYAADDVRACMAVVSQSPYLFHTTIRDNLLVARPDASDDALIDACRRAQLHDFIAALPDGYDTLVGENGLQLSGGERQRLAVARALLKDAPILILDEAAAQLDAVTAAQLWQALEACMGGRMVLILDHSDQALQRANRVLRLEDGRLVQPS